MEMPSVAFVKLSSLQYKTEGKWIRCWKCFTWCRDGDLCTFASTIFFTFVCISRFLSGSYFFPLTCKMYTFYFYIPLTFPLFFPFLVLVL